MKLLKWGIALCLFCQLTACNNDADKNTRNEDSVTTAPPVENMTDANVADPAGTGTDANNPENAANTESASSAASGTVNSNRAGTAGRTAKDSRTGFEKSGQYNSEQKTPEPPNLDDKKYKKQRPAHTYGDTAQHNDGLNGTR